MKLLVQKFGGTSVATAQARQSVYEKIEQARRDGYAVVAVLSAIGRKGQPYATDTLLDVFSGGHSLPNSREQDMIYNCGEIISGCIAANELCRRGVKAVFLTGRQAGIITDSHYSEAEIQTIRPDLIHHWLQREYVVLVAGGQGGTEEGDFTSIGRGGSDTTACAIGYYMDADEVRIYTDVDGIYTADPRIVRHAQKIPQINYSQCRRLAEYGAKVIHPKAVAFSQRGARNVLSVRSTFSDDPGTAIGDFPASVVGVAAIRGQMCVKSSLKESDALLAIFPPSETPPLTFRQKDALCCCIPEKLWGLVTLTMGGGIRDIIFAVGPNVGGLLREGGLETVDVRDVWEVADDCAAVLAAPESYESAINQIHDRLCVRG